jgi:predicted ATPase
MRASFERHFRDLPALAGDCRIKQQKIGDRSSERADLVKFVDCTFNGDAFRESTAHFLTLAEKQRATVPLMIGHRLVANSLMLTGDIAEARTHYDRALALYNPIEHRGLATRFGQDVGVSARSFRSNGLWMLGYPEAALADTDEALKNAREIGQAATLMFALQVTLITLLLCGNYAIANANIDELVAVADEKGTLYWKAEGMLMRGCLFAKTGRASDAIETITSWLAMFRSPGATWLIPAYLAFLGLAHADAGSFDDARHCIADAVTRVEETQKRWFEAEVNRLAGEVALRSPTPDIAKAEAYFERALAVARQQQAKSWELRAAMSMARLWRDQGKRDEARELLAPVYGWFTEGFDTRDLKDAKALLDELAS